MQKFVIMQTAVILFSMQMRKLYYYQLCPFSRTVLIELCEKKLDFSVEVIRFWEQSAKLLELNSFGRLPVLEDLNGSLICGVYSITEYLEDAYADCKLLPQEFTERAEARRIFQWMNEDFASEVTTVLSFEKDIKRYIRGAGSTSPSSGIIKTVKERIGAYARQLEQFIEKRNWLAGDFFSIADVSVAAQISVIDYLGNVHWSQYPTLKDWYMRVKSRPSFKKILQDRVPSIPPASHYSNLDF